MDQTRNSLTISKKEGGTITATTSLYQLMQGN